MSLPMGFSLLRVTAVRRITPRLARISFGGDLDGFRDVAPDQQVKLFFAKPGQAVPAPPPMPEDGDALRWYQAYLAMPDAERPWMRAYTVRRHDPRAGRIDIDFVLHDHDGPAGTWAASARIGDLVGMVGPAPSHRRTAVEHDWQLLVGDETALPAIAAILERLSPGDRAVAFVELADPAERQVIDSAGDVDLRWIGRRPGAHGAALLDAVRAATFPPGRVAPWIAGEASTVRAVRRHLVGERGVDRRSIAFTGYWRVDRSQDDPAPEEDPTDAEDRVARA
ncbi:siderophore-interacting protein [Actinoalloteichus sp. AHMU CJ021]|uniref:NADPH-dependent ferric siderophore reductase, contains FAD-binding and SIP domains n=2 Tax=Actinoalloteichus cyanogriseus TaxID=2893586 RepID=A0ABT1JG08_ACTCY|nr:siderophore-interacting protein [Actinoalloteichus caeruleus]AUS77543.1 siderophore-interacting protein [Actinoalloteichus sp. AHMU CJ021]MCP2331422.1 NADPH-dependent ferric siderophore reductase, contains FAD-binding and SIP domains [Actinoalloteichus caeruleus DSM 43889]